MTRILIAFIILFLLSTCSFGAETLKATGTARVTIVEPEEVAVNFNNYTVVYTEKGATAQVVF